MRRSFSAVAKTRQEGRRLRRALLAGRLGEAEPGVSRGGGPKGKRACPTPAAGGTQPPSLRPSFPRCKSNNPLFRAFRVLSWATPIIRSARAAQAAHNRPEVI